MNMEYDVLINKALIKIGELPLGEQFVLKDLFSGIEWNKLEKGERQHLGREFKKYVLNQKIPNVVIIDSPKGRSNMYKKEK